METQTKEISAIDALYEAQKIAFAPLFFQAIVAMRELGILDLIHKNRRKGITIDEIVSQCDTSKYGVKLLVEAAECSDVIKYIDDERITLTKTGYFLLSDQMTLANMNFVNDVCYEGGFYLKESIKNSKPEGLKVFGNWPTVYDGLSQLPEKVKKSWFEFDHFYSDDAFPAAQKILFDKPIKSILDIGGNTGKWSISCCKYDSDVKITIADLPGQIKVAQKNVADNGFSDRVSFYETNVLNPDLGLPEGNEVVWMSQFLDCFSEEEIVLILSKVNRVSTKDTRVFIMEPFWNNQRFEAAKYSLVGTSLYFTCMANGNSKMYHSEEMKDLASQAGFEVIKEHELIGNSYHTIQELRKK